MIPIIFIIKIAEFDHVLFKQRGDSRGEAATSCASSQIVQSLRDLSHERVGMRLTVRVDGSPFTLNGVTSTF